MTATSVAPLRADWMSKGSFGLMMHYLVTPGGNTQEEKTEAFDRILAKFDLARFQQDFLSTGADWLIFTLGQNTAYYNSPNAWLEARQPGHTSHRDLALEIAKALKAHGKRFIAYLPAEVNAPAQLHRTFGWRLDEPVQKEFQRNYQQFIEAYSAQFGTWCDGWWFDGCYEWAVFPSRHMDFAGYIAAARAGNPRAIVAFNDGAFCVGRIKPVTPLEDYHAGEIHTLVDGKIALGWWQNKPKPYLPGSRFVDGVQWHGLLPVDSTFAGPALPDQHYDDRTLLNLLQRVKAVGGALTFNVPVSAEGHIPEKTLRQMQRVGRALRSQAKQAGPTSPSASE